MAARPADTAFVLLLDFDGTLAEFNPDPAAPELTPERWELLHRIAAQARRLARHRQRPAPRRSARAHALARSRLSRRPARPRDRSRRHAHHASRSGGRDARIEGLADCLEAAARRVSRRVHRGQGRERGGALRGACRRTCTTCVFARADVLAVPWIAEGLCPPPRRQRRGRVPAEHQRPQGRGHEVDHQQMSKTKFAAPRVGGIRRRRHHGRRCVPRD